MTFIGSFISNNLSISIQTCGYLHHKGQPGVVPLHSMSSWLAVVEAVTSHG